MAFKDITKVLYDGKIKLDYKDKAHRYYARPRVNWDLPEDDPKAWGKIMYPKGTTTLIGDTLEKKGLMTWPLSLAIRELFGFYDFKTEEGERLIGFSKEKAVDEESGEVKETGRFVGTMWNDKDPKQIGPFSAEEAKKIVRSANAAWQRRQKKGADIGSVVHDAIEHFIKNQDFDIAENYAWNIKETDYENEADKVLAMEEFDLDVAMAKKAFLRFQKWWLTLNPELHSAEDILYSLEHNTCGTYDGDFSMLRERHPLPHLFETDKLRITADWKTSNASASKEAAAPEGVYYNYFVQLGIYELMRREMGFPPADDLLTVSARKDGEFSLVYASELGLTVDDCINWAECVIRCYQFADKSKKALTLHGEEAASRIDSSKEAF
jgi:hypothetical protein